MRVTVILQFLKGNLAPQGPAPRPCCVQTLDLPDCPVPFLSIGSKHTFDCPCSLRIFPDPGFMFTVGEINLGEC